MSALIMFRTLLQAQRGSRVLTEEGIPSQVVKAPRETEVNGCAYSVRLSEKRLDTALPRLRERGVPFGKIYTIDSQGIAREIMP